MNDDLPLLFEQTDELLLAVNVTADALINVIEITDDGGLLFEGWNADLERGEPCLGNRWIHDSH